MIAVMVVVVVVAVAGDVKAVVMKALSGYSDCGLQPMKLDDIARDWRSDAVRCDAPETLLKRLWRRQQLRRAGFG